MGLVDNLQKKIFGKKAVVGKSLPKGNAKPKENANKKVSKEKKKVLFKKKSKKKDSAVKVVPDQKVQSVSKDKPVENRFEDFDLDEEVFTEEQAVNKFSEGLVGVQDLIAPAAIEVDFSHMKMNEKFFRTLFVLTYPNMLPTNWMSGVINLPHNLSLSTFYYPIDSRLVMQKLKRKISEFQATLNMAIDDGKIPDPGIKIALDDAQKLQELLAKNEEKYFHYALYITIQADSLKELNDITTEVESTLGTLGIVGKPASLEMEQGYQSCIPTGMDNLYKTRNMSTDAISATFPFVTSSLTMDTGVLYGLNRHNNSLVVFDRFSMENANSVVFATSGAGKSYMVKLEIYRSMMLGAKVVVIDPEREYEELCKTVGGSYISFSQTGGDKINPFDLSGVYEEDENELADKRLFLLGLLKLMLGGVSPEEKALLDKAIGLTYQEKGITEDPSTQKNAPPLMEDLYKILKGMAEEEAHGLATRLEMFIRGAAAGVFDRPTSVDLNNPFTVFSLQELSDELRPIAMYMMLDYIWTRIRKDKTKRILVVDEAWYMMQHEDSARFLYWFAKRARKYYLGVTTITQDVEDFLGSKYGKAIVTNSAIKFLLKQNTAAIDKIQQVFKLSDGERLILLNSGVGEGLFFAGQNHVMIQVVSSEHEHKIVSTDPREAAKERKNLKELKTSGSRTSQKINNIKGEGDVVGYVKKTVTPQGGNLEDVSSEGLYEGLPVEATLDVGVPDSVSNNGIDSSKSPENTIVEKSLREEDSLSVNSPVKKQTASSSVIGEVDIEMPVIVQSDKSIETSSDEKDVFMDGIQSAVNPTMAESAPVQVSSVATEMVDVSNPPVKDVVVPTEVKPVQDVLVKPVEESSKPILSGGSIPMESYDSASSFVEKVSSAEIPDFEADESFSPESGEITILN